MRTVLKTLLAGLMALAAVPAQAHPHIFIDAEATLEFDASGALSAIRHAWTFDEAFSAYYTQGLDTDGNGITTSEEMQELADENMSGLSEYGFYSFVGRGGTRVPMTGRDARLDLVDNRARLTFTTQLNEHLAPTGDIEIAIADPEYYVSIAFADAGEITLSNPPDGCAARLEPPRELPEALADQLYALPSDVTSLPPELAAAVRGTQGGIILSCGSAGQREPSTAVEAVTAVAEARPTPFGGPPPEPGLGIPQSGPLRWITDQQNQFYASLTAALGRLKEDNTAFLVLGLLSFLYGVFHAAGPGHGKVVISTYMLATESQLRRGVALSFAAALLQSLVAIGLVLVATALLRLSTGAINDATHWIGVASYALLALLGLWLVVRRVFGLGHTHRDMAATARQHLSAEAARATHQHDHGLGHGHDHDDHDGHDHHHHDEHGHGHHHHVVPPTAGTSWREGLAAIFAAGLRPCSGALIVLVFALSQDLLAAGIAATLLMGVGTGLTVAVLASLAVSAKGFATRLAGGAGTATGAAFLWWAELAGGMLVLALGTLLLLAAI